MLREEARLASRLPRRKLFATHRLRLGALAVLSLSMDFFVSQIIGPLIRWLTGIDAHGQKLQQLMISTFHIGFSLFQAMAGGYFLFQAHALRAALNAFVLRPSRNPHVLHKQKRSP